MQVDTNNKMNVLYLGMAFDIMSPLLLIPDLDTIYAIDLVDTSYGLPSWDLHKAEMRLILTCGSDEKSQCRRNFLALLVGLAGLLAGF